MAGVDGWWRQRTKYAGSVKGQPCRGGAERARVRIPRGRVGVVLLCQGVSLYSRMSLNVRVSGVGGRSTSLGSGTLTACPTTLFQVPSADCQVFGALHGLLAHLLSRPRTAQKEV